MGWLLIQPLQRIRTVSHVASRLTSTILHPNESSNCEILLSMEALSHPDRATAMAKVAACQPLCPCDIRDCLREKTVPFLTSSDPDWNVHVKTYNIRLPYEPCLIALPETPEQIAGAVVCAGNHGIQVQSKSGGHSYASLSNGGKDGSMVVQLDKFQEVIVGDKGIAKVGGGVRLGPLSRAIYNQGKRALAHGTCSAVGIGGHYTHGGYGHFSRAWGLAMDQIVALDVVLADGTYVHADSGRNPEIFYAMRGAAEMIGIAVYFYLQTHSAPESVVKWDFDLSPAAPTSNVQAAVDTVLHVQDFAHNASVVDRKLSFGLVFTKNGLGLGGTYLGSIDKFTDYIAPALLQYLPITPDKFNIREVSWLEALKILGGDDLTVPPMNQAARSNFYAKSTTVAEPGLSRESVLSYVKFIANEGQRAPEGVHWYAILDFYGGTDSQINDKSTLALLPPAAFGDRNLVWVAQYQAYVNNDCEFPNRKGIAFVSSMSEALTAGMSSSNVGAYVNYADSEFDRDMAREMYYSTSTFQRLRDIKRTIDPRNIFANPQTIDPRLS
ncbi:hypothetical protein JX266_012300 [Neoarthrinium moseri]|nr:hypothetical protein JX266_012300 [Neoarthrinium moseri]